MTDGMPTLPNGWVLATLGEVVVRISNGITQKQSKEKKGLPVTRIETISEGKIDLEKVGFLDSVPYEMIDKFKLHPGDILFSNINSVPHLGKTAVFHMDSVLLLHGMNLLLVRAEPRVIMPDFLDHIFRYFRTTGVFSKIAHHAVNQSSINQTALKALQIPIPPLAEQQRIVHKMEALLQELTTARQSLQKVPALAKQLRQSVLAKAFRGELTERDPNDEPAEKLLERIRQERRKKWEEELRAKGKDPRKYKYKESEPVSTEELPKLPSGWEWATLEQIAFVERGKFSHRPRNAPQFYGGKYPFIQTGDIANAKGRIRLFKQTLNEKGFAISKLFKHGTIMVAIAANIGDSAILEFDACATDSVVGITCVEPISPEFVEFYLRIKKSDLESFAPATAQKNINLRILNPVPVPVAPAAEQRRIVAKINELFARADLVEETTTTATKNAELLEQAIFGRAFRGELVPQDPNDEPTSVLPERIRAQRIAMSKKGKSSTIFEFDSS